MSRKQTKLLLFTALMMIAGSLSAKVFNGANTPHTRIMEALSGRELFSSPIKINGTAGELKVFGFDSDINAISCKAASLLNSTDLREQNGSTRITRIRHNGSDMSIILLNPEGAEGKSIAITLLKQSNAEYSDPPNSFMQIEDPAESEREFSIDVAERNVSAAVIKSHCSALYLRNYYTTRLLAQGWSELIEGTSLPMLVKDNDICLLFASETESNNSIITLLHKKSSVE